MFEKLIDLLTRFVIAHERLATAYEHFLQDAGTAMNLHMQRHAGVVGFKVRLDHFEAAHLPEGPALGLEGGQRGGKKFGDHRWRQWTLREGNVVGTARFELTTSCSQSKRSTRLSYVPKQASSSEAGEIVGHIASSARRKAINSAFETAP